jgi:hypothetical protein
MVALSPERPPASLSSPTIEFFEFYKYGSGAPRPKPKLLRLNGKRVTLVGYMVQMESPPRGGFYLAPYPAGCDQLGTGRGGLPPPSVLVLPPAARGKHVDFIEGTLEVTGILDVGKKESDDGEVARIRLVLDGPGGLKFARTVSMVRAERPHRKEESR